MASAGDFQKVKFAPIYIFTDLRSSVLYAYLVFIDLLIFGTCSRSMKTPTPIVFSASVRGSAVRRIAMLQHVLASSAVSGLATAAHLSFSGGFNGKRVPLPQCKYILRRI